MFNKIDILNDMLNQIVLNIEATEFSFANDSLDEADQAVIQNSISDLYIRKEIVEGQIQALSE